MAINYSPLRLATEADMDIPVFRADWMSLDPMQKQQEAVAALASGYSRPEVLNAFNMQFGQGATMADLDFLLNYGKPATTVAPPPPPPPANTAAVVSGPDAVTAQGALAAANAADASMAARGAEDTTTVAAATTQADTAAPEYMTDFQGKKYDKAQLLALADQVRTSTNFNQLSGGVYGTQGQSVGFDYEEAKRAVGRDLNPLEQTSLDIARSLMAAGITDLSQIKATETQIEQQPTILTDEAYNPEYLSGYAVGSDEHTFGAGTLENDRVIIKVGETYTGEGATDYYVSVNPVTGEKEFITKGRSTSDLGKIQQLIAIASFIPGMQPFAMALNGAIAASQGDIIGALANMTGAAGASGLTTAANAATLSDVSNVLRAADAASKGNVVSAFSSLANTSFGAGVAGADLGVGNLKVGDITTAANAVSQIEAGNYGAALSSLGKLTNSADTRMAGAALTMIQAVESGNPLAMVSAAKGLTDITNMANQIKGTTAGPGAIQTAALDTGTRSDAVVAEPTKLEGDEGEESGYVSDNLSRIVQSGFESGANAYVNAKNAGATEAEALTIANAISNRVSNTNVAGGNLSPADSVTTRDGYLGTGLDLSSYANRDDFVLGGGSDKTGGGTEVSDVTMRFGDDVQEITHTYNKSLYGVKGEEGYTGDTAQQFGIDPNLPFKAPDVYQSADGSTTFVTIGDRKFEIPSGAAVAMGLVGEAGADLISAFAGVFHPSANSEFMKNLEKYEKIGLDMQGPVVNEQRENIIKDIDKAEGFWDKLKAGVVSGIENPAGAISFFAKESIQELPILLPAVGMTRVFGILAGMGTDAVLNFMETYGATFNEARDQAMRSGMSEAEANTVGMEAAFVAGGMAAAINPIIDYFTVLKRIPGAGTRAATDATTDAASTASTAATRAGAGTTVSTATDAAKDLGTGLAKTTGVGSREFVSEAIEEGGTAATIDYLVTGDFNLNNIFNSSVIGGLTGKGTAVTVETTSNLASDGATASMISAANPDQSAEVMNLVNTTLGANPDPAGAGIQIASELSSSGLDTATSNTIANVAVAESVVNQLNEANPNIQIGDLNTVVGTNSAGVDVTLGEVLGSSVTGIDTGARIDADTVIGTTASGQNLTMGQLSTISTGSQTAQDTTANLAAETAQDTTANLAAETAQDTTANLAAETAQDTTANLAAETAQDTTANLAAETAQDTTTNLAAETAIDTKTGVITETTTNPTTGVTSQTTTNPTTGITSQTTTNPTTGITTDITSNPTTNINTKTVVDTTTLITVTTTTNTKTGVTVTVTTDGDGKIISREEGGDPVETISPTRTTRATTTRANQPQSPQSQRMSAAMMGQGKEYPYEPTDPGETWLGGRFRKTDAMLPFAFLLPQQSLAQQEAEQFSALRRASGLEEPKTSGYYAYGSEPDLEAVLGKFMGGGTVQKYAQGGKILPMSPLMMAKGDSVEYKGSHYVQGAGGGQDDLIPAKLADGEYVFDAEIVAALGDGSNKEGARRLDAMREHIRKHKRGGSTKTIPPKAKSPLQYLSEVMK